MVDKTGLPAFRCYRGQKKATLKGWQTDPAVATTDPHLLHLWGDHPNGFDFALAIKPGGVVIDIDGPEARDAFTDRFGWPETFTVHSQRDGGGWHLYFKIPVEVMDIKNTSGDLLPGVDVRAPGRGLAIIPPSAGKSGRGYAVEDWDAPIADCPLELLAALPRDGEKKAENRKKSSPAGDPFAFETLDVKEGGRDNWVLSCMRAAVEERDEAGGWRYSDAEALHGLALLRIGERFISDPWTEEDIREANLRDKAERTIAKYRSDDLDFDYARDKDIPFGVGR